ncbi:amidase [Rhizobium puerariae]|uniref:Amidase n=1 Tax=Rhizobium puerariae TaxID=1585791 RepID=A0ABV6AJA3_9HYPH
MPENVSYVSRAGAFRTGADSPVQALENHLRVIGAREPDVRAFVCLDVDAARRQAKDSEARWRKNAPLSALDGMVIGVKDIIETVDFPTGQGLPALEGFRSGRDAASVAALKSAGAIVIGKTTTTEFASTELFYPTRNPHDAARTPGGSSSGSAAAVGCGMVQLALASQVVGSTLRPSSYNGAFGYKPTWGGLNRSGSYDYLSQSCVGIIGRHLDDMWVGTRQIAIRAGGDPGHVGVLGPDVPVSVQRPARVAVLRTDGWLRTSDAVKSAFEDKLVRLGAAGVEIGTAQNDTLVAALESAIENALDKTWNVLVWEMRWPLNVYGDQSHLGMSDAMRMRLAQGEAMNQASYAEALSMRDSARARLRDVSGAYDCILTLGAVSAAPADFSTTGDPSFNVPASYLGAPALSLPVLEDGGLPLGLQIIGGHHQDARIFAVAKWLLDNIQ